MHQGANRRCRRRCKHIVEKRGGREGREEGRMVLQDIPDDEYTGLEWHLDPWLRLTTYARRRLSAPVYRGGSAHYHFGFMLIYALITFLPCLFDSPRKIRINGRACSLRRFLGTIGESIVSRLFFIEFGSFSLRFSGFEGGKRLVTCLHLFVLLRR